MYLEIVIAKLYKLDKITKIVRLSGEKYYYSVLKAEQCLLVISLVAIQTRINGDVVTLHFP